MDCVQIEKKGKYTYIKCGKCGNVLITNDPELLLTLIGNNQLMSISSCKHFEVIEKNDDIEIVPRQS